MSFETRLFCSIDFPRKTYNAKSEVKDDLNDISKNIEDIKIRMHSFAIMTDPQKLCEGSDGSPFEWVKREMDYCINEYERLLFEKFCLGKLLENWNSCHNEKGFAIPAPESIDYDTAYLEGDYIKTEEDE